MWGKCAAQPDSRVWLLILRKARKKTQWQVRTYGYVGVQNILPSTLGWSKPRNMSRIADLASALQSPDLCTRNAALEQAAAEDANAYAEAAVRQIQLYPSDGYFVLERIGRFGAAAVPHLHAVESATSDPEIRILCTLALAHFKEPVDVEIFLAAIETRSNYECLACRALAWLGATSAAPRLVEQLTMTEIGAEWRIVSLVDAIRMLGGHIPAAEVERLTQPDVPLSVRWTFIPPTRKQGAAALKVEQLTPRAVKAAMESLAFRNSSNVRES